jgi:hypothetical protein
MSHSILLTQDLGGDMVAQEFLWRGPIYGCVYLPINNMVAHFWNIMVVVCIMYGWDPIMVALSKITVAPHICTVVKYGCVTYYHVNAGIR